MSADGTNSRTLAPSLDIQGAANQSLAGWSPDGDLIVYSGPLVAGQVLLLGVRPDGDTVHVPEIRLRAGAYRFLSSGAQLVYLPRLQSRDFWLLDLATGKARQLTLTIDQGLVRTFDITPDGTHIVFDRLRENSDIVLIDLPKQ